MVPEDSSILLAWSRFERLTAARAAFKLVPCLYVQTDSNRQILRIGKAGEGLASRYRGGTGYALDAAMHESGNLVFVAAPDTPAFLDDLERQLLLEERPRYNNQFPVPTRRFRIRHTGDTPHFRQPGTE
jgi:hypothetical protein